MRVPLINEASGVHDYPKRGLEAFGHMVLLAYPARQEYRHRPADISYESIFVSYPVPKAVSPRFGLGA